MTTPDLQRVGARFAIDGAFVAAAPYGSGHINDTYAATYRRSDGGVRFIHQRINGAVFRDPPALMANVVAVTEHVRRRLLARGVADADRRVLRVVPTREGEACYEDESGACWRTYAFVEGARSHDVAENPAMALSAARAFGAFLAALVDYSGPPLRPTIPFFHDTVRRYAAFEAASRADVMGRLRDVRDEVALAESRRELAGALLRLRDAGLAPERVTHNDTKVNNVLIDEDTGEGLCVIDLDTVMPGLALFDFGDMVRTASVTAPEDERDLDRIDVDLSLFAALCRGFLGAAGDMLTTAERAHLVVAAQVMTYQQALRFLTDHLEGDRYFRIHRGGHNLDRAKAQLRLLRVLDERWDALERIAESAAP